MLFFFILITVQKTHVIFCEKKLSASFSQTTMMKKQSSVFPVLWLAIIKLMGIESFCAIQFQVIITSFFMVQSVAFEMFQWIDHSHNSITFITLQRCLAAVSTFHQFYLKGNVSLIFKMKESTIQFHIGSKQFSFSN